MNLLKLQDFNGFVLILAFVLCGFVNVCLSEKILTNSYLIEFARETDRALADQIASKHGFVNIGPVSKVDTINTGKLLVLLFDH